MSRNIIIARLLCLAALVSLCALFVVQNKQAETVLGLNLGLFAWRFSAPVPVAPLVLGALGLGCVLGLLKGYSATATAQRRVRELERVQAFGNPIQPEEVSSASDEGDLKEDEEEDDDWG